MHGFAINVRPQLGAFDQIVPCGISFQDTGRKVVSVERMLGSESGDVNVAVMREIVTRQFASVFNLGKPAVVEGSPL